MRRITMMMIALLLVMPDPAAARVSCLLPGIFCTSYRVHHRHHRKKHKRVVVKKVIVKRVVVIKGPPSEQRQQAVPQTPAPPPAKPSAPWVFF